MNQKTPPGLRLLWALDKIKKYMFFKRKKKEEKKNSHDLRQLINH